MEFPNGEPSFYFHPFTLSEHQGAVASCEYQAAQGSQNMPVTGQLFGWTVHRAPLSRTTGDASLHGRIRLTARVACSLAVADEVIAGETSTLAPRVHAAELEPCSAVQREHTSSSVVRQRLPRHDVQHSWPSPHSLFSARSTTRRGGVQRKALVHADPHDQRFMAQCQSRAAEESQPYVQWIREGSAWAKFSEVDQTMIDVTCDICAQFDSELHAQQVFTRWIEFVCVWSRGLCSRN